MDLGLGGYLIISNCIEMPFDTLGLKELLKEIESNIKNMDNIMFFNCKSNQINYDLVWEGLETFSKKTLDYNDVFHYPLSSIDIKFKDCMVGRLLVTFLDKISYEISFITNYTEAFEYYDNSELKARNAKKIEQLAFQMFNSLKPVYGNIGVERSSEGLMDLKLDNSLLPIEKVYYSYKICNFNKQLYFNDFKYSKNLTNGIYLRNSNVDDYFYKESTDLKDKIIGTSVFLR